MAKVTLMPAARNIRVMICTVLALIVGFSLPSVAPEIANVSYLILASLGFFWAARSNSTWRLPPLTVIAVISGGLLSVSTLATRNFTDLLPVTYLLPIYGAAAYAVVLGRPTLSLVTLAAAAGCVAGLGVALYDAFVLGLPDAGASVNNPIHFASIVLILSFVSLVGFYDDRLLMRVVGVVGAAAGLVTLWLSGARGPLIALPPMLATGLFVMLWHGLARRGRVALVIVSLALVLGVTALIWWGRILDDLGPFSDAMLLLREGSIIDHSTWERVTMYQSAWNALLASPIHGHGLSQLVSKAALFAPEGAELRTYDHLHSDLADFAVGGGLLGLAAYFCLLLAPLFALGWHERTPAARAAVFLAVTVCLGYFVMGLTNAMFGLLSQTVLYSVIIAVVLCLSRGEATETGAR